MKKYVVIFGVIILIVFNTVCLIAGGTRDSNTFNKKVYPFTEKTIIDVVEKHKELSFISGALRKTGLAGQMAELEGYTIFIPTDDVIARLHKSVREAMATDSAVLLDVLTDQMVKGVLSAEDLKGLSSVTTMGGASMQVGMRGKNLTLSDSDLIKTDLFGNGFVVHIVTGIIVSGVTLKL